MRTGHIVFKNMAAQAGRLSVQGFAQLLVSILLARWLGFAALGSYAFVYAVVAGAAIFSDAGVTIFLSAEVARDRHQVNLYVSNLLIPAMLLGMLLSGVVFVLLRLFVTKGHLGLAGCLCATAVIAAGIASVLRGAVFAFERLDLDFYSIVIQEGLFTLAVAGLLIFHAGLSAVFAAFLITRWIGVSSLLYFYHRHIAQLEWRMDWRTTLEILRRVLPYGAHAFSSVISLRADTAVVYVLLGPAATGLYEAAANVSFRSAIVLPRIFTTALLPSLSRHFGERGAEPASRKVLRKLVVGTAVVGFALCGFFAVFARPIFHLAYGKLAGESTLVRVLAGAIAFHYLSALLGTFLTAKGLQSLRTTSVGVAAAAAVVLSVVLVPLWGVYGAAVAILASQLLMCALLFCSSFRFFAADAGETAAVKRLAPPVRPGSSNGRRRKIGIVVRHIFGPPWNEGVRNLAHELSRFLIERNCDVVVIAPEFSAPEGTISVPVAGVKGHGLLSFPLMAGWTARKLRLDTLLLVSVHSVAVGVKPALLRWASGAQVVVYVPGLSRFHRLNRRRALPANGVRYLVGSEFLRAYLPGADLIPPWVGLERDVGNGHCAQRRNRILYLGAFEIGRGVPVLLRACALLRRSHPNARLYIGWNGAGEPQSKGIQDLVRQLGLQDAITFLDVRERAEAYEKADVVVIPRVVNHYMAFPIRVLEAAQASKPMVVTTACDMHKLVDGCGLSAPAGDANALALAIEALLTDDELYARCQEGCRKFYERYHPQKSLRALYDVLQAGS